MIFKIFNMIFMYLNTYSQRTMPEAPIQNLPVPDGQNDFLPNNYWINNPGELFPVVPLNPQ